MFGLALPELALFALGNLKHDMSALWGWLCHRSFWQLAFGAVAIFALIQHFELAAAHRHSRKVETQLSQCTSARHADRLAYSNAQAAAQAKNRADVQRIETQQQEVTTDVETDYQRKLDVLRRELRAQPPAAQGSAGKPGVSQVPNAAGGPGEASGVPLPDSERLRAAENELQLDELISWVEQQSSVQH